MVMRRRVLRAIGQLELGGRGQGGLARLANLEHCAVQRRDGGEALGLCIRVSRERTTVFIAQRQTDLVLRALCVEHGEQHLAVAITALFVGRKDLAQAGRGRLRGVALSVCWAPLSKRKGGKYLVEDLPCRSQESTHLGIDRELAVYGGEGRGVD